MFNQISECPHVDIVIYSINYHKQGLSIKTIYKEGETRSFGLTGCQQWQTLSQGNNVERKENRILDIILCSLHKRPDMHLHMCAHTHHIHTQEKSIYINMFYFNSIILNIRLSPHCKESLTCRWPIMGIHDKVSWGSYPRLVLNLAIPFASVSHLLGVQMSDTKSRRKYFKRFKVKIDIEIWQGLLWQ